MDLATDICDLVTNGRTVTSACDEKGISYSAFAYACRKDGVIAAMYAHASEAGHTAMGCSTIDIADRDDLTPHDKQVRISARANFLAAYDARWSKKLTLDLNVKGDAREAERKADLRLARYLQPEQLGQVIDVISEQLPRLADKQSASAMDQGPPDSIFD